MGIFLRKKNGRCGLMRFIGQSLVPLSLNQTPYVLFKVIVIDRETLANNIASIVKFGPSVIFYGCPVFLNLAYHLLLCYNHYWNV